MISKILQLGDYSWNHDQILFIITNGEAEGPGDVEIEAQKWGDITDIVYALGFAEASQAGKSQPEFKRKAALIGAILRNWVSPCFVRTVGRWRFNTAFLSSLCIDSGFFNLAMRPVDWSALVRVRLILDFISVLNLSEGFQVVFTRGF